MKIEDVYPVSPLQAGLYYHWMISPSIYLAQLSYRLKGHFDIAILEKSYEQLVARHAILRTCFTQKFGEELLQVVVTEVPSTFKYVDVAPDFSVEDFKTADRHEGFNLNKGSQMRLTVLGLGDNTYEFVWSHHHILMDGWCVSILIKEFFQIYHSMVKDVSPLLNKVYPYSGYVKWLMQLDKEKSFSYWKEYLSGYDTISTLPKIIPAEKDVFREEQAVVVLEDHVRQSVRTLCRELGITENTFIQAAWGLLLCKYNNTNDVVYGTVVSGRPAAVNGIGEMIGLFTNNIPVRITVAENESVRDLLKRLQLSAIEGLDHHYTQLAQIQAESELGAGLFDHILVVENFPVQEMVTESVKKGEEAGEFTLLSANSIDQSNYDFAVVVVPEETFTIYFRYNASYYDAQTMRMLQEHLVSIITGIAQFPALKLHELEYLGAGEKEQLLSAFNQSGRYEMIFPEHTLVSLFEKQVQEHPDHIAVVSGTTQLSYRELDKKATQLAAYLLTSYAVKADDLVAILLDRSAELIVAILGVLKAGAAYVPIDMAYPQKRKEFLLNDSGAQILITQATRIFDLPDYSGQIFAIDVQLNDDMETIAVVPPVSVRPQDLAYVIYTSGSTGQPKGVMIEHGAISNTVQFQQSYFGLTEKEKGLQFASPSFDASVWEIFSVLAAGATLYIADEAVKVDAGLFESYINEAGISYATLPPAFLQLLRTEKLTTLRKLVTAGEAAIFDSAIAFAKQGDYYNAYGPTESSVCATIFKLQPGAPRSVPIGKPIANTEIYILDKDHNLLPAGVNGEIFIAGAGLARGYFNQPVLTTEKFVAHPFKPGERIYKTGDLGRWLPDGNIEFSGRKDDQVKIRGYRIELAEIEQALLTHPQIDAAFVMAGAKKEILAYIISKATVENGDLQVFLHNVLPAYMIPAHYIFLDALPLTSSGKVDRKQLPEPEGSSDRVYVAPGNEIEEKLAAMWQEILGKEQIGIKDNFFELGGHSLNITQLISRINNAFAVRINIKHVFDNPTIEHVAEHIVFLTQQDQQKQNKDQLIEIAL